MKCFIKLEIKVKVLKRFANTIEKILDTYNINVPTLSTYMKFQNLLKPF